jgi:hypothetical protein
VRSDRKDNESIESKESELEKTRVVIDDEEYDKKVTKAVVAAEERGRVYEVNCDPKSPGMASVAPPDEAFVKGRLPSKLPYR